MKDDFRGNGTVIGNHGILIKRITCAHLFKIEGILNLDDIELDACIYRCEIKKYYPEDRNFKDITIQNDWVILETKNQYYK